MTRDKNIQDKGKKVPMIKHLQQTTQLIQPQSAATMVNPIVNPPISRDVPNAINHPLEDGYSYPSNLLLYPIVTLALSGFTTFMIGLVNSLYVYIYI